MAGCSNSAFKPGLNRKLCPLFNGPYLVVEVKSPYIYRVVDQKRSMILHHDKMRVCETRTVPYWVRRKRHDLHGESMPVVAPSDIGTGFVDGSLGGAAFTGYIGSSTPVATTSDTADGNHVDRGGVIDERHIEQEVQEEDSDEEWDLPSLFDAEPVVTRRGRVVQKPLHFKDYVK